MPTPTGRTGRSRYALTRTLSQPGRDGGEQAILRAAQQRRQPGLALAAGHAAGGCGQERKLAQLPVLAMVCAYSALAERAARPDRTVSDLFAGWWHLIGGLGAMSRGVDMGWGGRDRRWRAERPELTAAAWRSAAPLVPRW
jgi:hypothetical protein